MVASGACASMFVHGRDVDAAPADGGSPADAEAGSTTPGCRLDLAGGTYALMDCAVVHQHRQWTYAFDSGIDPSPRVVITGGGAGGFPSVDLWFYVPGEPRVGPQWQFLIVGYVEKSPAKWRVIAGGNSGTTGTSTLTLTQVKKIRVDGGVSYEMHGSFVATMPEVTGVRGPDVVMSGVF
jgi:hypothetical protein